MSERISALEMAVGFEIGGHDRAQLTDWVDAEVLACERVEGPLLELTSLRDKGDHAIVAELLELAGVEAEIGTHRYIACLGSLVEAGRVDVWRAFSAVYSLMLDTDDLTDAERSYVYQLDQDCDAWDARGAEGVERVRASFVAFTSRYRHLLAGVR